VNTRIESPLRKRCWVRKYLSKTLRNGIFWRRSILRTSAARPCRSSVCNPPPAYVASRLASGETRDSHGLSSASERRALALLPGRPPPAPTPAANSDPPIPSSPPKSSDACPINGHKSILGVSSHEKKYRTSRAGDLGEGVQVIFSKALRIEASRHVLVRESQ
jgi:hypothetical protein